MILGASFFGCCHFAAHRGCSPLPMATGDCGNQVWHTLSVPDRYLIQVASIRSLNDELRTRFRGGSVVVDDEIRELGHVVLAHALLAMAETESFDDDERSSGRFWFCARVFRWSISYGESPNPVDPKWTKRVLYLAL